MQDLINDLLAFSRVGRMEQPHIDVDCDALVERVRADLGRAIEESGAEIVVDGELPTVQGDAALLRLVFQNLIGNAIKFRGEAAPRVGALRRARGRVLALPRLRQRDRDRRRVRGADLRASSSACTRARSTRAPGIGLAMCRKIVEYHGGRMWLDTGHAAAGEGSTFYFTLPAEPDTESR